jgi:hypothetical protein
LRRGESGEQRSMGSFTRAPHPFRLTRSGNEFLFPREHSPRLKVPTPSQLNCRFSMLALSVAVPHKVCMDIASLLPNSFVPRRSGEERKLVTAAFLQDGGACSTTPEDEETER